MKMDPHHLTRLQEEQKKAIDETNHRIDQCVKYKSDYKALKERLKTLPDAVTHDIMVPFGRLGFMPGKLVHTNEIMVLLGDNWFAERSAKQAAEIADRRIKELNKQIRELKEQRKLLTPRLDFTTDLQSQLQGSHEVQEIIEEYDEEKERLWDEQHKKNVKKQKEQLRQKAELEQGKSESKTNTCPSDQDLWSLLDQLEKLEEEKGYLNSSAEDSEEEERETDKTSAKPQVTWADEAKPVDSNDNDDNIDDDVTDEADDEDGSDAEEETTTDVKRVITFSHSKTTSTQAKTTTSTNRDTITSPADIYRLFNPKPILKKTSSKPKNVTEQGDGMTGTKDTHHGDPSDRLCDGGEGHSRRVPFTSSAQQAFSGKIVERNVDAHGPITIPPVAENASQYFSKLREDQHKSETAVAAAPAKRVSRFKAQRMQNSS